LYELDARESQHLAATLVGEFELTLSTRIDALPSHADLVRYATRTGHRTRPVGCLLACTAVGGDWRHALDAAVAVEFVHKSSVIRDDIVDGDEMRSGQPAMHVAYDVPRAIAVSDVLWSLGLETVGRGLPPERAGEAVRRLSLTVHEMALGQIEDVAPSTGCTSIDQRAAVEERKTGALSGCACGLGAFIGGAASDQVSALERYGRKLGTAFQILNDVRNLRGDENARRPASDVRLRRDTILSAFARVQESEDLRAVLDAARSGSHELNGERVEVVREAIMSTGACEFGEQIAHRLMLEAGSELRTLPPTTARSVLESLTQDALLSYAF
jgi:geranylgeranyl diphosphate synthase type I